MANFIAKEILQNTLCGQFQKKKKYTGIKVYLNSLVTLNFLGLIVLIDTVGSFNVVFTKENEIIDVIARISNNHFTKCIRIDSSQTGLISIPDTTNGYQCSHEFFKDEMLQEALQLALKGIEENLAPYPKPYIGNIFPQESNYKIWPIKNGNDLYKYGKIRSGPFYLVFDTLGNIKGALVKGLHDNYLRCIRKRVAPTAPASDPLSKLFVPAPKPGYMCGRTFFEDENLKEAAEIALRISTQNLKKSIYAKSQFPTKHNGKPFNRPYLLWPIVRFGALYQKGNPGPYRVALELDHKVICAVMVENNIVKQCEKMTLKGNINHDTSDYLCLKQIFYNDHLVRTTEEACRSMKKYLNAYFPAAYRGPGYESEGPYFTYPIKKKGFFRIQPGPHRIVINSNCKFVGALTTIKTGFGSKLVKCHRLETDPEITEMPIVTNEHISEQRILT